MLRLLVILCLLAKPVGAGHNEQRSGTIAGAAPASVTSCGTGSPSVTGTNGRGVITIGGGTVTACTLNFGGTWPAAPVCVVHPTTATGVGITTVSTTLLTVALASPGAKLYYHCLQ